MALALFRPLLWVFLIAQALLFLWLARSQRLRWWPAWLLRSILVAFILIEIFTPQGEFTRGNIPVPQILIIDQSASLSEATRQTARQQAQEWADRGENRIVIAFGDRSRVVLQSDGQWPEIDDRASNLAEAIHMYQDFLVGNPGIVLLASDGLVNEPVAVLKEIEKLNASGVKLSTIPLEPIFSQGDGYVGSLWTPPILWEGTPIDILVNIHPLSPNSKVSLDLYINDVLFTEPAEEVGQNNYRFRIAPQPAGIYTIGVTAGFNPEVDPLPENNTVYGVIRVFPSPKALLVSTNPEMDAVTEFTNDLVANGIQVDRINPQALPTNLSQLETYRVIFLHNLLAKSLTEEQMVALKVFVEDLGGGLIFLGGRNSYTLGGYQNTLFETLLPVKLEPPPRSQRPPVLFLIVMDVSGSMASSGRRGIEPIDLAREAAMRAVEILKPEDYLGILTFSDQPIWEIPIRTISDGLALREALDVISKVVAGGGTNMYRALKNTLDTVNQLPATAPQSRHLLLFSDGQSHDGSDETFSELAQSAAIQDITISTIALGTTADRNLLRKIAEISKGRFHPVMDAEELPNIMVLESQAAHSENIQTGQMTILLSEPEHPILYGMTESQLPHLSGYNALTSKVDEGAEDVLISATYNDPILSVWQFGLGRVVAWMGDIGEEWESNWTPESTRRLFWTQVIRYALPNPELGPTHVNVLVKDTELVVTALIQNAVGDPLPIEEVLFTYSEPNGKVISFLMSQTDVSQYQNRLIRPPEGAYRAAVVYKTIQDDQKQQAVPFSVNYPVELRPIDAEIGLSNLKAWAELGGGQVTDFNGQMLTDQTNLETSSTGSHPWLWVLFILILMWPIEIVVRRRWLPWT